MNAAETSAREQITRLHPITGTALVHIEETHHLRQTSIFTESRQIGALFPAHRGCERPHPEELSSPETGAAAERPAMAVESTSNTPERWAAEDPIGMPVG